MLTTTVLIVHVEDHAPHIRVRRENARAQGRSIGASTVRKRHIPGMVSVRILEYGPMPVGGKVMDSNRAWRLPWRGLLEEYMCNLCDCAIISVVRVLQGGIRNIQTWQVCTSINSELPHVTSSLNIK